jgi:hypothetical protein
MSLAPGVCLGPYEILGRRSPIRRAVTAGERNRIKRKIQELSASSLASKRQDVRTETRHIAEKQHDAGGGVQARSL